METPTNRRRFERSACSSTATLTANHTTHQVTVHDLSLNGALISGPACSRVAIGSPVQIKIALAPTLPIVTLSGVVAYRNDDRCGLRASACDLESATVLRHFVESNADEAKLLEREFRELLA